MIQRVRSIPHYYFVIGLTILAAISVICAFTGQWPWQDNAYNSYSIQAQSWLDGRLDIGENRPWLELAIYQGKYYVSFPPFPSYVLLPFVLLFGEATPDHWITLVVTLIGSVYATKIYKKATGNYDSVILYVLFIYLASGFLLVGFRGGVWHMAQNMCFTLSLMSIWYALKAKGGLSLLFWACAVGCRPMTVVFLPILIVILWRSFFAEQSQEAGTGFGTKLLFLLKKRWYWAIGPLIMGGSYMILNYARFGSILEFGHNYLPEHMTSEKGQFSFSYLGDNLAKLFRLPGLFEDTSRVDFPFFDGFAIYIVQPIFVIFFGVWIYRICRQLRRCSPGEAGGFRSFTDMRSLMILLPVLLVAHAVFICLHVTLGGYQFGNRYLVDALPWVFFGLIIWKPPSERFDRWMIPLMMFGYTLNLVGTINVNNGWL